MRIAKWLVFGLFCLLLSACQAGVDPGRNAVILDASQVIVVPIQGTDVAGLIANSGLKLGEADRLVLNGAEIGVDFNLPEDRPITLQVHRSVPLRLVIDGEIFEGESHAATVGQAMKDLGVELYAHERVDTPLETPLTADLIINIQPSRTYKIEAGGRIHAVRSSARTVGEVVAEAGLPLEGLDFSLPAADEPVPGDGFIKLVQVQETVLLEQKNLPFSSEFMASADLELDRQDLLQFGETGLAVSRIRVRYEDGQEVSRFTEAETVVRPAQNRIIGYGTKIVIRTAVVDGVTLEYWRTAQMYATSYSPCRSAADRCYPGTSSGKPVKKGVVAVKLNWWRFMAGDPIYVPGYGFATIEDVGGGIPGRYWIDLAYSDEDWVGWSQWVTVYFLTPVPATIMWVLE